MTALVLLMLALQIGDVLTTGRFLEAGKRELNPIIRYGLEHIGFGWTMLVKVVLVMAATVWLALLGAFWPLVGLCVIYAGVVVNNWRIA